MPDDAVIPAGAGAPGAGRPAAHSDTAGYGPRASVTSSAGPGIAPAGVLQRRLVSLANALRRHGVVVVWAGMRGVVTLAAAQTLPSATADRPLLIWVAFLVALSSLLLPCRIDDPAAVAKTYDQQARLVFNVTGTPAISVPTGFAASGLPLAMQIASRAFDEPTIFRIAQAYCEAAGTCIGADPKTQPRIVASVAVHGTASLRSPMAAAE